MSFNWIFIDKQAATCIEGAFEFVSDFYDGIAWIKSRPGYRFINTRGEYLFDRFLDEPTTFREGLAPVRCEGLYGFIDTTGEWVIEPQFNDVGACFSGLIRVRKQAKSYFIGKSGAVIVEVGGVVIGDFQCGLAAVRFGAKSFFINRLGEKVLGPFEYVEDFSEGVAFVQNGGKTFFVESNGQVLFESKWEWIEPFCHCERLNYRDRGYYGFLDLNGRARVPALFDSTTSFYNRVAVFERNNKKGLVDADGEILFEKALELLGDHCEDLSAFANNEGKCGFCNRAGEVVIPPTFESARRFACGLAAVRKGVAHIDTR